MSDSDDLIKLARLTIASYEALIELLIEKGIISRAEYTGKIKELSCMTSEEIEALLNRLEE